MNAAAAWLRTLPARYGRRTLIALAAIAALGLVCRAVAVADPVGDPADDSHAYYALAKSLYEEGSFGGPSFRDPSDWSPGAPWLYAAAFVVTGGPREGTIRVLEALLGVAAILVVFALAWRLGGRVPALLAAFGMAIYPPFLHSTGEIMSEPPAVLTLPAAVLAFLWASERPDRPARWLAPGALLGATAMFRPEYLLVAAALVVLAVLRTIFVRPPGIPPRWRLGGAAAIALLAALLVLILPWTIRNLVVLDRAVPISTGGGKALYVGTYLPADGEYQRVKALLYEGQTGRSLPPDSQALNEVDPVPLFDRVANEYKAAHGEPDLPRDSALGKIGKHNLSHYLGDDPGGYLAMTARKIGRMWSSGVGAAMSSTPGRVVQVLLVLLGLAGLALLGASRRFWELLALATPIALVTAVGAISLAAPRRGEVLMTLVFPLAALALSTAGSALSSGRSWRSPLQESSPPN